jgi:NAD(P)-dependent dehydrogenase (short-subunit alcohol dehydrogenase family)
LIRGPKIRWGVMGRLANKAAIVFGAGPNIGGTIAHFLAREGARIIVSDLSLAAAQETVDFIRSRGFEASAVEGNATSAPDVERIVDFAVATYGRVDIAVNMAGRVHWSHLLDMDLDDWNESVLSFPTAGLLTTKFAARAMIAGGHSGSIIHLLSTAAHFGEATGAAYTSSKAALLSFARSAAMDLAQCGIRVNTVTPCAMEHQLWTLMRDEVLNPEWQRPERMGFYSRDDYLKMLPLQRFPRASDLAWATVFLASDESEIITGIDIPVDAGLRHKYPTWTPGIHSGVNISDYAANAYVTRFGERHEKLIPESSGGGAEPGSVSQEKK